MYLWTLLPNFTAENGYLGQGSKPDIRKSIGESRTLDA